MDEILYDNLDQALKAMESGVDLETVLSDYPETEGDLRPVLEAAQYARLSASDIPPAVIHRGRTRLLARAKQIGETPESGGSFFRRVPQLVYALALAVVFLISFGGLSITSAQALPGDQLYPIQRVVESLRLDLSVSLEDHLVLEDRYQNRRIDEVKSLLDLGRMEMVEFNGKVILMEVDGWDIGGIDVHLTPQTILIGDILPGVKVEVEGISQPEGYVQASEIHLQNFGFVGYVESITPEFWKIAGRTIQITPESHIKSDLEVGDWVVVSVRSDDFGNLFALIIDATTLPTPIPEPTDPKQAPILAIEGDIKDSGDQDDGDDKAGDEDSEEKPEIEDDDSDHDDQDDYDESDDEHRDEDEDKEEDPDDDDKEDDEDDEDD